ncbi:MAG: hypothetical protein ACQESG_01335 [Nanobdellota archaeon]
MGKIFLDNTCYILQRHFLDLIAIMVEPMDNTCLLPYPKCFGKILVILILHDKFPLQKLFGIQELTRGDLPPEFMLNY